MRRKLLAVMATISVIFVCLTWGCVTECPDCQDNSGSNLTCPDCPDVNCGDQDCNNNCGCCDNSITGVTIYVVSDDSRVFDLPAWFDLSRLDNYGNYDETLVSESVNPIEPDYFYELEPGTYIAHAYYSLWQEPVFYGQVQFEVVEGEVTEVDLVLTTYQIMTWYVQRALAYPCGEIIIPQAGADLWFFEIYHDWDDPLVEDYLEPESAISLTFTVKHTDNVDVGACWLEVFTLAGYQPISSPVEKFCWEEDSCEYYFDIYNDDSDYIPMAIYPKSSVGHKLACDVSKTGPGDGAIQVKLTGFGATSPDVAQWTIDEFPPGCTSYIP